MKIFGFEINGQNIFSSSDDVQKKTLEIGDSGTEILHGVITEEYNSKLQDIRGINVYDEMRKSDGTVKSVVLATSLPIRRAKWFVQSATDDQKDKDIAEFVESALFEYMTMTWDDLLRQALLSLPFGVMAFEKVFTIRTIDGVDRIVWKKFAPRLPKSIQKWELENGDLGIQQLKQSGKLVDIPMSKLCVFVNEMEGENWWGTSILRAAYKHWYIKNNFYKIDAIAFERQGLGIPYAKMPENYTEADRAKAETILKNLRAHQQAFIVEPHDYEIGFKDMMAKTLRDPKDSIGHHNREIVKGVLATFLELGATNSGSRALSEDQSGLFLQSLEAVAGGIADVFNTFAIPQLVDMNFDNVDTYPQLKFAGISRVDVKKLSDAYSSLTKSGGIKAGEADEKYFREILDLPERDQSDDELIEDTTDEEDENEEIIDELGMSDKKKSIKKKVYPTREEISASLKHSIENVEPALQYAILNRNVARISQMKSNDHSVLFSMIKTEALKEMKSIKKYSFAENENDFKSFRKLTFAEEKVDFKALEQKMDQLEESFNKDTRKLLSVERKKYMNRLTKAVQKGDKQAIKDAAMKVQKSYSKIINDSMKESYEYGKIKAANEMGVTAPKNSKAILDLIDVQSDAIADMHLSDITNDSKTKMVEALNKGESTISALSVADAAVAKKIVDLTRNTSQIIMSGYINHGRNTVFEENQDDIYALQRSEILDSKTCNYCLSIDGRIIEKDDPFAKNTIFHSGCRGIWVEILLEEEELPPIGGIPKTIRDRFGDAVNDLIQPKKPKTKQDSDARKEVEKRAKRKKKQEKSK